MKKVILASVSTVLIGSSFLAEKAPVAASTVQPNKITYSMASTATKGTIDDVVNLAKQQVGKPYVFGASGPSAFDCSGLMYYVLKQNGYVNSRLDVAGYWSSSFITKVSTPQKGDLIFFKDTYKAGPSHMGIMIDSTNFVHAANSRDGVTTTSRYNSYYQSHFLGYGRLVGAEAALTIQDIKPNISLNTRLGVIRNFETTVIRKGPGASYSLNTDLGAEGYVNPKDQYVVSEYKNGWYKIGTDAWVYSEHFIYRPTTTNSMILSGTNSGTISTPTQVEVAGVPIKPVIGLNKQIGVVRNFERTVIRKGPGATNPINTSVGSSGYINPGDQYIVYEYKNGWYRIGTDAWIYSEHNNLRPSLEVQISNS